MKKVKSIMQGFKDETLAKIIAVLKALIDIYRQKIENGEHVKLSISQGNIKIGRVMNVSLAPIITCGKACGHCKRLCYDIKACLQYANVRIARTKNTALAIYDRKEYFDQIEKALARRKKNYYFRWHVSGDIIDYHYLCRMIDLAKKYHWFTFWTYTKQYHLVNRWIDENGALPNNLTIMFSAWKIKKADGTIETIPFPNLHNLPVFTVRFAEEKAPKGFMKCPGNCDICKQKKIGCIGKKNTYADGH